VSHPKPMPLVAVVRWVITTLIRMAQNRDWGEVRITVQGGQIMFVHQDLSYRDRLPEQTGGDDQVRQVLAAAS